MREVGDLFDLGVVVSGVLRCILWRYLPPLESIRGAISIPIIIDKGALSGSEFIE